MHNVFDTLPNITANMTQFLKFLFLKVGTRNLKKKSNKKYWKQSNGFK